ncbi:DOMON-like domain-containing protein [Sphingomonas parva]|uniref:DOMON-like domain-containing protein n=1 Tax=Sphingomonas parva TaxID=2555898 RepID=A0A4Y8ZWG1_9SPHN|nr:DOMON-like domain-containing protein [Sphingomonas parva]TFI60254.1 DOMON-like domain-containing protein [Sphingomonas parva]
MVQRLQLRCHPDTPSGAFDAVMVDVRRNGGRQGARRLSVRYVLSGNLRALKAPQHVTQKARADDLWRHTCFEAFVRVGASRTYHEFNLAPSGAWSCYRFDDYRSGMQSEKYVGSPAIGTFIHNDSVDAERAEELARIGLDGLENVPAPFFLLTATLDMEETRLPLDEPWHLGLSAVIEERNGTISYWALNHPPGDPDFHHPDCFALELAPARPA